MQQICFEDVYVKHTGIRIANSSTTKLERLWRYFRAPDVSCWLPAGYPVWLLGTFMGCTGDVPKQLLYMVLRILKCFDTARL
eukprot:3927740-Pleurochrysis_carterae.AAC.2